MKAALPTNLHDALAARSDAPSAIVLAGGTDVMVAVNSGRTRPASVVALRRVHELAELSRDRIGAGVTWRRLLASPDTALAQAARTVGSAQIRAVGTIGGNVGTASPAGDGLTVLAALDASIEVASVEGGTRLVAWRDFFVGVKRTALRVDELITAIVLPSDRPTRSEFAKVGVRGAMVIAIVNACVARSHAGTLRVALGAVGPTVIRATRAEAFINGQPTYTVEVRDEFMRLVREEIAPITDHRSTAEYRRHAAGVVAARLLDRIMQP